MASFLPLLLAGGAILALSGKKKSKGAPHIPLDKPVQVKKDGLVVNSGRSPVPPAVYESPLEPFEDVQQVQEALIAAGKPPKGGADGKWGGQSQGALDAYNHERGFKAEARDHLATPDSLRSLHADAGQGTADGRLANPGTGAGTTLFCSLSKGKCPPGHTCIPVFNTPIPGYEDVGYCVPTSMLEAGRKPTPEDYAPGGYNEVVFSSDYESVSIGKGWRFQTLEPWLYTRMKKGKLLTFALEGGLFWEDLISTEPKSFWNSTLASAGLAVPAGAAIGTKGWLSYRHAFRSEIPVTKMVAGTTSRQVRFWNGPEGFVPGGYETKGAGAIKDIKWPPPADIVEKYAGWKPGGVKVYSEYNPYNEITLKEPKGKNPYAKRRAATIRQYPDPLNPQGGVGGIFKAYTPEGLNVELNANTLEEAVEAFKKLDGGTKARANRMVDLYGDELTTTVREASKELVEDGTRIAWAKPKLASAAKAIGAPLAIGAVVYATVYGGDYLAKKMGDKQRDLIAESAVLAWKKFASSHYVRVGNKKKRIDKLPDVIAVQFFQTFVAQSILRFQKNTYE